MTAVQKLAVSLEAALEISALDITLNRRRSAPVSLVRDVSLKVGQGQIHALVGESGSGKTLLARSIVQLLPPAIKVGGGSILFNGRDLASCNSAQMRQVRGREIGFVFQEPMLSLNPAIRIGEQMAEGMRHHLRLSADEIRHRSLEMLRRVSMKDPERALRSFPHEFSGGMRQRIMLASVLALRPSLLIADEPTTALDAIIQRDVLDIMVELTRDLGTSVMLITHDLGLVAQYADEVTVMQSGQLKETGPAAGVIRNPRDPYTRNLLAACPKRQPRPPIDADAPVVLKIEDLHMRYRGGAVWPWQRSPEIQAVTGLALWLRAGETLAVVGESGSGKTTVGRAVMGLRPASSGSIDVVGERLDLKDTAGMRRLRCNAQIVFQDPASSLDPRLRVGALVGEGLRLIEGIGAPERAERVAAALLDVGLGPDFAERLPHELSGGQRQRVAIARAIILAPKLIVADEAVSALDVTVQAQVLALLSRLQKEKGFAYLFISHDLGVVQQIADRIMVMRGGRVMEVAARDDLFDRPHHPYTRRLLAASAEVREQGDGSFKVQRREPPPLRGEQANLPFFQDGHEFVLSAVAPDRFVALSHPHPGAIQ